MQYRIFAHSAKKTGLLRVCFRFVLQGAQNCRFKPAIFPNLHRAKRKIRFASPPLIRKPEEKARLNFPRPQKRSGENPGGSGLRKPSGFHRAGQPGRNHRCECRRIFHPNSAKGDAPFLFSLRAKHFAAAFSINMRNPVLTYSAPGALRRKNALPAKNPAAPVSATIRLFQRAGRTARQEPSLRMIRAAFFIRAGGSAQRKGDGRRFAFLGAFAKHAVGFHKHA